MNRNLRVLMAAIAAVISGILCYTEDPDTGAAPVSNGLVIFIIGTVVFFITLRIMKLVNDVNRRDAAARRTVNKYLPAGTIAPANVGASDQASGHTNNKEETTGCLIKGDACIMPDRTLDGYDIVTVSENLKEVNI